VPFLSFVAANPIVMAQLDTALSGTHECRLAQLLQAARHEAGLAQIAAAPRLHDALAELENILQDQIAALANASDDDKADAAMAGIWADDD
jgi:hypothetical protein